jgi:Putative 2OG-Fe(II) oxygenase
MKNEEFYEYKLPNPGVLKGRLPPYTFKVLSEHLKRQIENDPKMHNGLIGHIVKQYVYEAPKELIDFIDEMYVEYRERFDCFQNLNYNLDNNIWVNLQRKGEYNPSHEHDGVISWVLWVSIPYKLEEELQHPLASNSNGKVASMFQFTYPRMDGKLLIHNLPVDKNWEGSIIMFPAYLRHQVYPFFTSENYRVSISGNIHIIGENNAN